MTPQDGFLEDETLERWRAELEGARDVDLVMYLLTVHKLMERKAVGEARYLAEAEATAIAETLKRFASVPFHDALAISEEAADPIAPFIIGDRDG